MREKIMKRSIAMNTKQRVITTPLNIFVAVGNTVLFELFMPLKFLLNAEDDPTIRFHRLFSFYEFDFFFGIATSTIPVLVSAIIVVRDP